MCIKLALNASRIANLIVYRANDYGDTTPSNTRGRPLFKRKSFNSFFGNRLILFIVLFYIDLMITVMSFTAVGRFWSVTVTGRTGSTLSSQ